MELKSLNKLTELKVISSTLATASTYYERVKSQNFFTRNTLTFAEYSVQAFSNIVALPLTNYFVEPGKNIFYKILNY